MILDERQEYAAGPEEAEVTHLNGQNSTVCKPLLRRCSLGTLSKKELLGWETCASRCVEGDVYALPFWARAACRAYGLKSHIVVATRATGGGASAGCADEGCGSLDRRLVAHDVDEIIGVLALIRVRHWLFGDSLVSLPFCDSGGGIASDRGVGMALMAEACALAESLGVPSLDLRRQQPLMTFQGTAHAGDAGAILDCGSGGGRHWRLDHQVLGGKVRMRLSIPDDPDVLMRSFKSKLRSQINKPIKEGLKVRVGGLERVDDFYRVFVENMRDLGSPVHSRQFIEAVVSEYREAARVFIVERHGVVLAGSVTLGFNGLLSNPWSSSLRRYSHLAPNMLLYWSMLAYGCEHGYQSFDFGRSAVGEGTYRFKEQWGARPEGLYWYRFSRAEGKGHELDRKSGGMSRAVEVWKRLPLTVTRILGPRIRRHISL